MVLKEILKTEQTYVSSLIGHFDLNLSSCFGDNNSSHGCPSPLSLPVGTTDYNASKPLSETGGKD